MSREIIDIESLFGCSTPKLDLYLGFGNGLVELLYDDIGLIDYDFKDQCSLDKEKDSQQVFKFNSDGYKSNMF